MPIEWRDIEVVGQPCQKWDVSKEVTDEEYYTVVSAMEKARGRIVAVVVEIHRGVRLKGNLWRMMRTVKNPIPTYMFGDTKNIWVQMALKVLLSIGGITLVDNFEALEELFKKKYAPN